MYLRRGFLASAAEEWMGVCQQDPRDVRGLVGLAQVAAAQGMTEDAIEFAREARALDPGDATCDATARAARAAGGVSRPARGAAPNAQVPPSAADAAG